MHFSPDGSRTDKHLHVKMEDNVLAANRDGTTPSVRVKATYNILVWVNTQVKTGTLYGEVVSNAN